MGDCSTTRSDSELEWPKAWLSNEFSDGCRCLWRRETADVKLSANAFSKLTTRRLLGDIEFSLVTRYLEEICGSLGFSPTSGVIHGLPLMDPSSDDLGVVLAVCVF